MGKIVYSELKKIMGSLEKLIVYFQTYDEPDINLTFSQYISKYYSKSYICSILKEEPFKNYEIKYLVSLYEFIELETFPKILDNAPEEKKEKKLSSEEKKGLDEFYKKIEKEKDVVKEIMNALARFIMRSYLLQDLKTDEIIIIWLTAREDIWSFPEDDLLIKKISDNFPQIYLEKICDCYIYLNNKINPSPARADHKWQTEEIIPEMKPKNKGKTSRRNKFQDFD